MGTRATAARPHTAGAACAHRRACAHAAASGQVGGRHGGRHRGRHARHGSAPPRAEEDGARLGAQVLEAHAALHERGSLGGRAAGARQVQHDRWQRVGLGRQRRRTGTGLSQCGGLGQGEGELLLVVSRRRWRTRTGLRPHSGGQYVGMEGRLSCRRRDRPLKLRPLRRILFRCRDGHGQQVLLARSPA